MEIVTVATPLLWVGLFIFVGLALAFDLGVLHRKAHTMGTREAAIATAGWIGLGLLFNVGVYFAFGATPAMEFLTAYVVEKALSVDNIFVFIMLFSYFAVPGKLQHRVLFFGILGAVVFRGIFIFMGTLLLQQFHWIMYLLGALLLYTGYKMLRSQEIEVHPENNPVIRFAKRLLPITEGYRGDKFFVKEGGIRYATPLLLVLVAVETTDIVFAVDSIPAVLAITQDPFIVFSSNVFAILGLRALYFLLASAMRKFDYLQLGLAVVLAFIGGKMLLSGVYKLPTYVSLLVIGTVLTAAVVASLVKLRREGEMAETLEHPGPVDPVEDNGDTARSHLTR